MNKSTFLKKYGMVIIMTVFTMIFISGILIYGFLEGAARTIGMVLLTGAVVYCVFLWTGGFSTKKN